MVAYGDFIRDFADRNVNVLMYILYYNILLDITNGVYNPDYSTSTEVGAYIKLNITDNFFNRFTNDLRGILSDYDFYELSQAMNEYPGYPLMLDIYKYLITNYPLDKEMSSVEHREFHFLKENLQRFTANMLGVSVTNSRKIFNFYILNNMKVKIFNNSISISFHNSIDDSLTYLLKEAFTINRYTSENFIQNMSNPNINYFAPEFAKLQTYLLSPVFWDYFMIDAMIEGFSEEAFRIAEENYGNMSANLRKEGRIQEAKSYEQFLDITNNEIFRLKNVLGDMKEELKESYDEISNKANTLIKEKGLKNYKNYEKKKVRRFTRNSKEAFRNVSAPRDWADLLDWSK